MSNWFGGGGGGNSSSGGDSLLSDDSCGLSRTQRLYAFGGCFITGMLLSLLSTIALSTLSITTFAVFYTLGGIVSLCSTMFLFGPWGQIKRMFDKDRIIATSVYLGMIVLTLIVALSNIVKGVKIILVLVCIVVQFLALMWYSLSYVPYGRTMVKSAITGCFK